MARLHGEKAKPNLDRAAYPRPYTLKFMKLQLPLSVCVLASAITVGAQSITVIDDFASGQLISANTVPGQYSFEQTGPETSIMGGTRHLVADVGSGYLAFISTSAQQFRFEARGFYSDPPPPQTSFALSYGSQIAPLSLDLKAGDAFQVSLLQAISGGGILQTEISLQWQIVTDAKHISKSPVVFATDTPGALSFAVADFKAAPGVGPADLNDIRSIVLNVTFPDAYSPSPIIPPPYSRLRLDGLEILTSVPEPMGGPVWLLSLFGVIGWRSVRQSVRNRG